MGRYLNPGSDKFQMSRASKIYVDKSGLISYLNDVLGTEQRYVCVSRPRRFGKSMAANMLAAYYQYGINSEMLFDDLCISSSAAYRTHLNQYNVIFLNMQEFLSRAHDISQMEKMLENSLLRDLLRAYPDEDYFDPADLVSVLLDIYEHEKVPFIFIIDEWDCIFRENKNDSNAQKLYLDFLRTLLKDKSYVRLAYMTGILPIKKYGTHSALNMFSEFSMTDPDCLAEYTGFTEEEVKLLCLQYHVDFAEEKRWYDGYRFEENHHIYNPRSVVASMMSGKFKNYWTKTETYEALKIYIEMNFEGLKDAIVALLAGEKKKIDIGTFSNDMTNFQSVDDVFTLLVHLGYLAYDTATGNVFVPNSEVSDEFVNAVKGAGWHEVTDAVRESESLLEATWQMNEDKVAEMIDQAHMETSILTYNDENALSYTLALAYYCAKVYYTVIRELPTGKGFADLVYLPRKNHLDKPAMIVELKWDKTVEGAIDQIKRKEYTHTLKDYSGNLLLVGINYNKAEKTHVCRIEKIKK